jgi:hypothetical protein
MPWAKLDDRFHSHPKVREAWYKCPASIGLHCMAITFAADHQTDGAVPGWFVAGAFQKPKDLQEAVGTLVELGMWEQRADGFLIHDFLKYHTPKAEREAREAEKAAERERERERKRQEREQQKREEESGVSA